MSAQIGPYQIIEELGQGGMAIVYKALQPSVNRIVALKVLPSDLEGDEVAVRRFRQEAETAANLTQENIVRVWDASVTSPPYYIAMEFLEGGTLADRLANGPLALEESAAIITCVCAALDHAHERGVIHRDIKPANIMFDGTGKPVVTDFGIARVAERTRFTMTGASLGTPDYMSPEQTKGIKVDHRTDLYSVGAVLYEMLTGQPPFTGEPLTVMYQIVNEEPPRLAVHRPDIPPAIEPVVIRALAKGPDERHQSGREMAEQLWAAMRAPEQVAATAATVEGEVTSSGPAPIGAATDLVTAPARERPRLAPRKGVLAGILAAVLMSLGGILAYNFAGSYREGRAPPPPMESSKQRSAAAEEPGTPAGVEAPEAPYTSEPQVRTAPVRGGPGAGKEHEGGGRAGGGSGAGASVTSSTGPEPPVPTPPGPGPTPPPPETVRVEVCKDSAERASRWCPKTETRQFKEGQQPTTPCTLCKPARVELCAKSGKLANDWCPKTETRQFKEGQQPTDYCTVHKEPKFECHYCDRTFDSERERDDHEAREHLAP